MKNYFIKVVVVVLLFIGWGSSLSYSQEMFTSSLLNSNGLDYPVLIQIDGYGLGAFLTGMVLRIYKTKPDLGVISEVVLADGYHISYSYEEKPVPLEEGYYEYMVEVQIPGKGTYMNSNIVVKAGVMDPKYIYFIIPGSYSGTYTQQFSTSESTQSKLLTFQRMPLICQKNENREM